MIRRCLFVGGRFDGHFYDADIDMSTIRLSYDPCTTPYYLRQKTDIGEIVYENYNRVELRYYNKDYFVYVAGAGFQVIDLLINGYVSKRKGIV